MSKTRTKFQSATQQGPFIAKTAEFSLKSPTNTAVFAANRFELDSLYAENVELKRKVQELIAEKTQNMLKYQVSATSFHLGKTAITTNNTYFSEISQAKMLQELRKLEEKALKRKKEIKRIYNLLKDKDSELEILRKTHKISVSETLKSQFSQVIREFEANLEEKYHRLEDELLEKQRKIDQLMGFIRQQGLETSRILENEEKTATLQGLQQKIEKIQRKLANSQALAPSQRKEFEEMLRFLQSEQRELEHFRRKSAQSSKTSEKALQTEAFLAANPQQLENLQRFYEEKAQNIEKSYQERIKLINRENSNIQERLQIVIKDYESQVIAKNKEIEEFREKLGGSLSSNSQQMLEKSLLEKEFNVITAKILEDFATIFQLLGIKQQEFQHLDIECCFELLGKLLLQLLKEKNERFSAEILEKTQEICRERDALALESKTFSENLREFFVNHEIFAEKELAAISLSELLRLLLESYRKEVDKYQTISQEYHREYEARIAEFESKSRITSCEPAEIEILQKEFLQKIQNLEENHKKELETLGLEKDNEKDEYINELNQAIQDLYYQKRILNSEKKEIENDLLKLKMKLSAEIQSKEDLQGKLAKKELEFSQKFSEMKGNHEKLVAEISCLKTSNQDFSGKVNKLVAENCEIKKNLEGNSLKHSQEITLFKDKLISLSNQISDLQQNNEFLMNEFKAKLQDEKRLLQRNADLETIIKEKDQDIEEMFERIHKDQEKLQSFEKESLQKLEKLQQAGEEIKGLRENTAKIEEKDEKIKEMQAKLEENQEMLRKIKENNEELFSQKTAYELHLANQKEMILELQAKNSNFLQNINDLQEVLGSKDAEIQENKQENSDLRVKVAAKDQEIAKSLENFARKTEENQDFQQELSKSLKIQAESEKNRENCMQKIEFLEKELENLRELLVCCENQAISQKTEISELNKELGFCREACNFKEIEVSQVKSSNSKFLRELQENEQIINKIKEQLLEKQENIAILECDKGALAAEISQFSKKIEEKNQEIQDFVKKIQEIKAENEEVLKREKSVLLKKNEQFSQKLGEKTKEIELLLAEKQAILSEIKDLQLKSQELSEENERLAKEIATKDQNSAVFSKEIAELRDINARFLKENQDFLQENRELKATLSEKLKENEQFSSQTRAFLQELETLHAENLRLSQENEEIAKELQILKSSNNLLLSPEQNIANFDLFPDQEPSSLEKSAENYQNNAEIASLQEKLHVLSSENEQIKEKLSLLQENRAEKVKRKGVKENTAEIEDFTRKNEEISRLRRENEVLSAKLVEMERKLEENCKQIQMQRNPSKFGEEMFGDFEDFNEKSNIERSNLIDPEEILLLRSQISSLEENLKKLTAELEVSKEFAANFKENELNFMLEKQKLQRNNEVLQGNCEFLEKQIQNYKGLTEKFSAFEEENSILRKREDSLKKLIKIEFEEVLEEKLQDFIELKDLVNEGFQKLKTLREIVEEKHHNIKEKLNNLNEQNLAQQEKIVRFMEENQVLQKKLAKRDHENNQMILMSTIFEKIFNEILKHSEEIYKENCLELFELEQKNSEHIEKVIEKINAFLKKNKEKHDYLAKKVKELEENLENFRNKSKLLEEKNAEIHQKLESMSQQKINKNISDSFSVSNLKADFAELFGPNENNYEEVKY